jgi:Protein kinase domain
VSDLVGYLRFKARGIPRRLLQEFNSFVAWTGAGPVLSVGPADEARLRFYAQLERIVDAYIAGTGQRQIFPVPIDDDRWRLGCYYVADWVLQSEGQPFSAGEVLGMNDDAQFDPLLRISRRNVSQLLDHLTSQGILEVVREVVSDLDLGVTRFEDVPEADSRVYRLVTDVQRALFGFAARNEGERGGLEISLVGPSPVSAFQPGGPQDPLLVTGTGIGRPAPVVAAPTAGPNGLLGGRYELRQMLGQGGMGTVWAGEDRFTDRPVAVKIMRASMHGDPKALARVRREAEINSKLMHPQIVRTYDVVEDSDDNPALVMEFLDGPTLAGLVELNGPRTPVDAALIGHVLADALAYLGSAGIVRVDLKPSNIIMHPERGPVIIDLGVARVMQSSVERFRTPWPRTPKCACTTGQAWAGATRLRHGPALRAWRATFTACSRPRTSSRRSRSPATPWAVWWHGCSRTYAPVK